MSVAPRPQSKTLFYRFRKFILACAWLTGIVPRPLLRWSFLLIEPCPGTLAVFFRYLILKNLCKSVGDNVYVANYVEIRFMQNLELGNNVSVQRNCYLDAMGGINIGNDVSIAHQSSLVSFDHGWEDLDQPIRKNPYILNPITIKSDVWIGAGARILAGSQVASRCIVAAGAVVTKKTPFQPYSVIAGVPAKVKLPLPGENNEPTEA